MAARRTPKAKAPEPVETDGTRAPEPVEHPTGWAHDWRNPAAVFAADDQCLEARMARLRPR